MIMIHNFQWFLSQIWNFEIKRCLGNFQPGPPRSNSKGGAKGNNQGGGGYPQRQGWRKKYFWIAFDQNLFQNQNIFSKIVIFFF